MFDIRRRAVYSKIVDKLIAKKPRWRGRAVALLMSVLIVLQMLVPFPWGFAGTRAEQTDENELWMHPRIEFDGANIYDGVGIPLSAMMNAVYEFTLNTGQFPIEVSLPDVLKAVTGEYSAVAFDVYGEFLSGVKVIVDEDGVIKVYFEPDAENAEGDANADNAAGIDVDIVAEDCCESCADDNGSIEPDMTDLDSSAGGNPAESSGDAAGNNGNSTENPTNEAPGNAANGSSEPAYNDAYSADKYTSTGLDAKDAASSKTDTMPPDSEQSGDSEDGIRKSKSGSSISMFGNAGALTASAFYSGADGEQIRIEFEIPVHFDIDNLPPMPEPVFNEDTEEWEEAEPWLVDVFHTVLEDDEYVGEFVTVEVLPGEFELSFAAMDDGVLFDDDAEFYAEGSRFFMGIIDWNDNGWTYPWDTEGRRPDYKDFELTLYFEIPGRESEELTAQHLVDWGWVKVLPAEDTPAAFETALEEALKNAQEMINTPIPTFSGLRSNFWTYAYSGLPTSLREIIGYEEDTDPAKPIYATETVGITYSFKMKDTSFESDYIIADLSPSIGVGYINTRREVFTFTKEWKDANNKHLTRVGWDELSANLNFSRLSGDDTVQLGTLADFSENIIPDVTITYNIPAMPTPPELPNPASNRWTITISDIPMFDSDGTQFHYFVNENNDLSIAGGHNVPAPYDTVRYVASYENVGASAEDIERCFNQGVIINRLTDEVGFDARKVWQDDNAPASTRPRGSFQLNRYPNTPGMSYRTASVVSGFEIEIDRSENEVVIDFSGIPGYPLPRFDSEGQEYVYFVRELITSPGFYRSFPVYSSSSPFFVPDNALSIDGTLFNGGTLNNRRVGSAGVSVTKRWEAAARQSMNASITVRVERRLSAMLPHRPEASTWEWVTDYELSGFRAEVMELTHSFGNLPKFDGQGREYEYRISEVAVTIDEDKVDVPKDQLNPVITFDDGYVYRMGKSTTSTELNDEGTPIANTRITNTLIGESEVRIRKTWNGTHPNNPQGTVRFVVTRADGGQINWIDPNLKISMDNSGTVTTRPTSTSNPTLTTNQLFIDVPDAGQAGGDAGGWLVISGLPRYDERGREIVYVVREVAKTGYHNSFQFRFYDRLNPRVGVTEADFTNTPAGESGRYVTVHKEWADDGDLACRGNVVMELYHVGVGGSVTYVSSATLTRGNDWMAFMRLSHKIQVPIMDADNEPTSDYIEVEDQNYNNYFVRERHVVRGTVANPVNYLVQYNQDNPAAFPYLSLGTAYGTRLGALKTDAHFYDVFAKAGFTTGSALNTSLGIPDAYVATTSYRTSYTFRNVRTGEVEIDIRKNWNDALHHERVPQQVQIEIHRRLNYTNAYDEDVWHRPNEDDKGNLISDTMFNGIILLQWNASNPSSLQWNSTSVPEFPGLTLPKYSPDGVLYIYRVTETYVHEMAENGTRIPGRSHIVSGGSYVLSDGHRYSASVVRTRTDFGDHRPGQTEPRADEYSYTVTNQRSETINFAVYKLWHDVARVASYGGEVYGGVAGVDFDPRMEAYRRPDIFLTLYQTIDDKTSEVERFVGRTWSTTGLYNEYYWKCTFESLERYTSSGVEIFYSVVEGMPNRPGSDYVTEYWELIAPAVVPNPWIRPSPVSVVPLLNHVTDKAVYKVPVHDSDVPSTNGHFERKFTVTAEGQPGSVGNGGIIVNRREATRSMSGYKVWKNVPSDTLPAGFPTIEFALMQRDDNSLPVWQRVLGFSNVTLHNGNTSFAFGAGGAAMEKYDEFGVYIRYRAEEVSQTPGGYKDPVYNDYLMEVTNEYDVSTEAQTVTVSVTKTWNYAPFTLAQMTELNPVAKIELWRVMTTGAGEFWNGNGANTSVIGGNDIRNTEIKVGEIEIRFNQQGVIQTFSAANLGFDLPEDEEDLTKLGKLLRIGYNGQPYRYFLRESLDGYTFIPGPPNHTVFPGTPPLPPNIPRVPTTATFHYDLATNRYDGFSSDIGVNNSLVSLGGTKDWVDSTNLFGTRPNGGFLYANGDTSLDSPPSVTLRVYRAIAGNAPNSILPGTFQEITNSVDIVWTKTAGNDNRWGYVVNAGTSQAIPVGVAPGGPGTASGATLYRFSLTGVEFIYFVEEVSVNHHYQVPVLTGGAAIPSAMIGNGLVTSTAAGNLRVMATGGTNKVASFRNTLRTTTVPVTKAWERQAAAGSVPMSLENPSELEMMIPPSITLRLQYREMYEGTVYKDWDFFNQPGTGTPGTPYTIERNRAEIISALRASGTHQMTITFNNPLLPQYGNAPDIIREYRFIETRIGDRDVTAGSAGGFIVAGNDGSALTPVINAAVTIPLTIRKVWEDDNNRDGTRPSSITFRITRDNNSLQFMDVVMTTTANMTERTVYVPQFMADGVTSSTYTVEELIGDVVSRMEYDLLEAAIPAGSFIIAAPNGTLLDGSMVYQFTNKNNQRKIDLTVSKNWSDADIDTSIGAPHRELIRPEDDLIYVTIQRSPDGINWADMTAEQLGNGQVPTVPLNVSNESPWTQTHTWTGLTARHDQGEYFHYRVRETNSSGTVTKMHAYTATYRIGSTGTFYTTPVSVTELNTAAVTENGIVKNVARIELENKLDTVRLDVEKVWRNSATGVFSSTYNNQFAPTAPVTVKLYYRLANGDGQWIAATGINSERTITGAPWTANFTGLPKVNNLGITYQYTVREVSIGGMPFNTGESPYSFSTSVTDPVGNPSATAPYVKATVGNTLQTRANITVNKIWDDNNNQDGRRPEYVTVRLIRDMGVVGQEIISAPVTLRESNYWSYTFENLPMYRRDGTTPSSYHVAETSILHYHPADFVIGTGISASGTAGSGAFLNMWVSGSVGTATVVNITNRYTPQVMNITAEKVWVDQYPYYDTRPNSVKLRLLVTDGLGNTTVVSGLGITNPAIVDADNLWSAEWNNLPLLHNIGGTSTQATATRGITHPLIYTVVELNENDEVGPITSYHKPTIVYSGGNSTAAGIKGNIATPSDSYTATVTNTCQTLSSITVNKIWNDGTPTGNNPFAKTAAVEVMLYYRLAVPESSEWTSRNVTRQLTSENQWTATFTNLPRQNYAGIAYQYTVREIKIGNVDTAGSVFPLSYQSSEGTVNAMEGPVYGITVTNTLQTRGNITVTKEWDDDENQDGLRPEFVRVRLIKDMNTTEEIVSGYVELRAPSWSHTFTNLPRYRANGEEHTVYHVQEEIVTHYDEPVYQIDKIDSGVFSYMPATGGASPGNRVSPAVTFENHPGNVTVTVKNSYEPKTMNITAQKFWTEFGDYPTRPASIHLRLYATTNSDGITDRIHIRDFGPISAPSWTYTLSNLPINSNELGTDTERGNSQLLYYTIVEVGVAGYTTSYTYELAGGTPAESISGSIDAIPQTHLAFATNTLDTVNVTVNKAWNDRMSGNNPLAKTAPVRVELLYRLAVTGQTGGWIETGVMQELTLNNQWTGRFDNLPVRNSAGTAFEYTVREISIDNVNVTDNVFPLSYQSTASAVNAAVNPLDSITITNTLVTRNDITVRKEWNDSNNQDGIRPASVQVRLIMNMNVAGQEIISEPMTLNAANGWTHTFTNLPRYNDTGGENTYRVIEVPLTVVPSYSPAAYRVGSVTGFTNNAGTGVATGQPVSARVQNLDNTASATVVTVQNSYTPRSMSLTAEKLWNDQNNLYDTRPDSIRLQLYVTANPDGVTGGAAVGSPVTVIPTGSTWTHTWNSLPVMRNTGGSVTVPGTSVPLYYSVVELGSNTSTVNGYSAGYVYTPTGSNGAVGSSSRGIRGSISDDTNTAHSVTITNNLDTVSVTVRKQWGDFGDLYRLRPEHLTFTLQRRIGTAAFENVVNSTTSPAPVTQNMISDRRGPLRSDPLALDVQELVFTGLPRFDSNGNPWDYRVIETGASGVGITNPFSPNTGNPTGGTIGNTNSSYYTFRSSTVPIAGGFRTTVINEVVMEKIAISGIKTWNDGNNRFGFRPNNLELNVYYDAGTYWAPVAKSDYDVVWVRNGNVWSYTIRGHGLTKYEPGTDKLREFAVQEVLPSTLQNFYNMAAIIPPAAPPPVLPVPENSTTGQRNPNNDNGYIINANFTNSLKSDEITSLSVHKDTDFGPKAPLENAPRFTFEVYFSLNEITDPETQGTLLTNHDYHVIVGKYAGDESVLTPLNIEQITSDGKIEIAAGESFVIRDLPQGMYFYIVEDEHHEFGLKEGSVMNGRLGRASSIDPLADLPPTLLDVENVAIRVVSIVNTTPNEGISQNGGSQAPSRRTNAGGTVTVEENGGQMYTGADGVEGIPDALAVRWEPEGFWTVGGHFTIRYIDFGETEEQSITVTDYLNPDGTPKTLEELLSSADNPEGLRRFISAGARLHITPNGAVRLVLSHLAEGMPRSVTVEVRFVPTLAVNNVTVDESGSKIGGNVMVIGRDGFDEGNLKICSDGVPALGGKPYVSQSVYGIPIEGFTTDWSHIAVRNLNELDCVYVLLEPCEDGYFTAQLSTTIAGVEEIVEKTGRITRGSVLIEFDGLPVPLQVDLRFIPINFADDSNTSEGTGTGTGGLPQTGVVSMLWILVLGLMTSIVATAAVLIVIRRQSVKDKR
ncbi:MAG: Cna B-type domain-containing protein [Oscillospiraceae bacterium]|nr:Cna B-type domain-containing protein [Oscillospiraceae bacterium]